MKKKNKFAQSNLTCKFHYSYSNILYIAILTKHSSTYQFYMQINTYFYMAGGRSTFWGRGRGRRPELLLKEEVGAEGGARGSGGRGTGRARRRHGNGRGAGSARRRARRRHGNVYISNA